jgi:hypothetical protein
MSYLERAGRGCSVPLERETHRWKHKRVLCTNLPGGSTPTLSMKLETTVEPKGGRGGGREGGVEERKPFLLNERNAHVFMFMHDSSF